MGACGSREAGRMDTAKLILPDGTLQEFSSPVKVWQILQKNPTCFVCNSDEMDFDDAVSAVNGSEDLRPGQLYFVLPLTWLNHPLRAKEMAALAVKASLALTKSGGAWDEHWTCGEDNSYSGRESHRKLSGGETKGRRARRNSNTVGGGCGKGKRRFAAELSTIAE
ncbi:PREDICTED: uncharacterized protein LOC104826784 [Tarenaya hassleriana]|uniref:uncharacterized protein LOC104826784 n=1 Tax=Tarenaya hassleriana TaxID=28532 RepID=UPI00053C1FB4|nr:PREDICTED: uncharacterized protein LOC104826784 [Tarenaya hassleriana]